GKVTPPAFLEFLTIDNSYGEMPDECPNEVTPHILSAMDHFSDAPGVLTWVYPFEEFHQKVFGKRAAAVRGFLQRLVHAQRGQRGAAAEHGRLDNQFPGLAKDQPGYLPGYGAADT